MIIKKSPEELDRMREAGRVVAKVFSEIRAEIKPGVRTRDLDKTVERVIRGEGCTPWVASPDCAFRSRSTAETRPGCFGS